MMCICTALRRTIKDATIMPLRVSQTGGRLRLLQLYICVLLLYATVVYLCVLHVHHEAAAQRRRHARLNHTWFVSPTKLESQKA